MFWTVSRFHFKDRKGIEVWPRPVSLRGTRARSELFIIKGDAKSRKANIHDRPYFACRV